MYEIPVSKLRSNKNNKKSNQKFFGEKIKNFKGGSKKSNITKKFVKKNWD